MQSIKIIFFSLTSLCWFLVGVDMFMGCPEYRMCFLAGIACMHVAWFSLTEIIGDN